MLNKRKQKQAEEGYSDIAYKETWNIDETLAPIIAKHLRAFLQAVKTSPYAGVPGILSEKYGLERSIAEWHSILRKMIYAFEEYRRTPSYDLDEEDDHELSEEQIEKENSQAENEKERQRRIKEGRQLFVDYYDWLWW